MPVYEFLRTCGGRLSWAYLSFLSDRECKAKAAVILPTPRHVSDKRLFRNITNNRSSKETGSKGSNNKNKARAYTIEKRSVDRSWALLLVVPQHFFDFRIFPKAFHYLIFLLSILAWFSFIFFITICLQDIILMSEFLQHLLKREEMGNIWSLQ